MYFRCETNYNQWAKVNSNWNAKIISQVKWNFILKSDIHSNKLCYLYSGDRREYIAMNSLQNTETNN